jgi:glucosamine 6-phosphate synthetase-like amidotransferase/phosphosugar isomerase protein
MCGIVGMAGNILPVHERAMKTLLVLDSLRGEDSTGIVCVGKWKDCEVKLAKSVGDPFQLFDHKSYENAMQGSQRVIIGHNRAATSGAVTRNNAHPFDHPTLVGVHNGTLKNKHVLDDAKDYKVDSDNLYHHIEKSGLRDAMNKVDGAWALVWWDKVEHELNILRNKERPLWTCVTADKDGNPDFNVIFWASEPWMLRVALSRHGIQTDTPVEIDEDVHVRVPIQDGGKLGKPTMVPMAGTYKDAYQNFTQGHGYRGNVHQLPNNSHTKPQEDKTLSVTKKLVEESQSFVASCNNKYLQAKNVVFEIMEGRNDKRGEEYLLMFDKNMPYDEIRVYPRKDDEIWDFVGGECQADIQGYAQHDLTPSKGYYTVRATTVKILPVLLEKTPPKIMKGQTCDWCSDPLDEKVYNRTTTTGGCFCPHCAKERDVTSMVTFSN